MRRILLAVLAALFLADLLLLSTPDVFGAKVTLEVPVTAVIAPAVCQPAATPAPVIVRDRRVRDFHGPMPGPRPDFHGGGDFHQGGYGGFHGGYSQPWYNPMPFIAPFIVNYATAPRNIQNPITGQWALMTPGQWVTVNAGTPQQTVIWSSLPVWPLLSRTALAPRSTRVTARAGSFVLPHPFRHWRHRHDAQPDPQPTPDPIPTPDPTPQPPIPDPGPPAPVTPPSPTPDASGKIAVANLMVICVVPDLITQSADMAAIQSSPALASAVGKGRRLWVDAAICPKVYTDALQRAVSDGLPRAIILDHSVAVGKRIVGSVPIQDAATLAAAILKYRSK